MQQRKLGALATTALVAIPALALADAAEYEFESGSGPEIQILQQHTVFVELFSVKILRRLTAPALGAIVGLIKECQIDRSRFDNAVLWFNDQFLFGHKIFPTEARPIHDILGENVEGKFLQVEEPGDPDPDGWRYTKEDCGDRGDTNIRHATFIPDLWVAAAPAGRTSQQQLEEDAVLDAACGGCLFSYRQSYFVTDPNFIHWLVDVYRYRQTTVYITHIQVDPVDLMGFRDEAPWLWSSSVAPNAVRPGAPRYDAANNNNASDRSSRVTDGGDVCPGGNIDPRCSIEYNFLFAVDLNPGSACKRHGKTGSNRHDSYLVQGNSHRHNPQEDMDGDGIYGEEDDLGPLEEHECMSYDVMPLARAPHFSETLSVWESQYRAPPPLNETCEMLALTLVQDPITGEWTDGVRTWAASTDESIDARFFEICDTTDDFGRFHVHDGSQSFPGGLPP